MITGQLKSQIDKLWTEFWSGGVANPMTVIEQISFLTFARMLDIRETENERKAKRIPNYEYKKIFVADPQPDKRWDIDKIRWSKTPPRRTW